MGTIKEEVAKNLLFYRKRAGLTQKQLAEKLGVKNTSVSNWESGNNSMDIDTLFEICGILNVSINDMYGKYSNQNGEEITAHEMQLVKAYRSMPSMQAAVDKLLNVEPDGDTVTDDMIETVKRLTGKSIVSK